MIRKSARYAFALMAISGLMLAGCSQMEPAKQAIDGVEAAVKAAGDQAGKYIPDQLASAKQALADLKTAFDAKDYSAVMSKAPAALKAAQDLVPAAAAKKDEVVKAATANWTSLSGALPGMVAAVQNRVTALSKTKHLPAGVDLNAAKSALAEATEGWTKAQAASTAGNVEDAASLAAMVKEKAAAAAQALKLPLPGA